jgi:hypothetical protein
MKNWTDSCINWHQLSGTETKRLIATWGMTPEQIAKYDKKHGFTTAPVKAPSKMAQAVVASAVKTAAKKVAVKKVAKAPAKVTRQKHTGADGEIKFVEHRNLFVGFFGGKVVVTKRTKEQCAEVLRNEFKLEI